MNLYGLSTGLSPAILLGMFSGLISLVAYVPYLVDALRKRTRPHRASWFVWSLLATISFFSLLYEGAGASLWFVGAQAVATTVIFLVSLRYGVGNVANMADAVILFCAGVGLVLWYFTETAVYALGISITISLIAGYATVLKAYRYPGTETYLTWALCFIGSVLAMGAVGRPDIVLLAYPAYLFVLNGAIILAIFFGKHVYAEPAE